MERVLLFGGSGILGTEVLRKLQSECFDYLAPRSFDLDIRNRNPVGKLLQDFKPTWIINCAAWTNVDDAENSYGEACELNEVAVENLAIAARSINCKVIHISTDYVFDGQSERPYEENSLANPINKYGESKLRGERSLLEILPESFVIRTSWLYGAKGKNFVKTIAGKALRNELTKVVDDQTGCPTSARDLAEGIVSIIRIQPEPGIYHFSNEGSCSWFELAKATYEILEANTKLVEAIKSIELNQLAKRPAFSILSKKKWISAGLPPILEWNQSLELHIPEIVREIEFIEEYEA